MDVTSLVASKFAAGGHLSLFFAEGTRTPDRRRDADRELYWHGVQAGRVALKGTTVTGLPSRGCAKKWSRAGESGEVEIPAYTVVASGPGWRWREELARQVCRSASRGGARYRVNVRSGGFFCLDPAGPAKRRHTNLDTGSRLRVLCFSRFGGPDRSRVRPPRAFWDAGCSVDTRGELGLPRTAVEYE